MTSMDAEFSVLLASPTAFAAVENYSAIYTGCRFHAAESNVELLLKIGTSRFDLAVIDAVVFSDDVMALLKSMHPGVPLIALLDNDSADERQRRITAGFDDCLAKPLAERALGEVIALWSGGNGQDEFAMAIAVLLEKFNQNRQKVHHLLNGLYEELPRQIEQLQQALQMQDFATALHVAHKINGSAKVCALPSLGDAATRLESALRDKTGTVEEGFQQLKTEARKIIARREQVLGQVEG
jgi:HPt (histidine-containing phosphotransfer) domain-containing protein